MKSNLNPDYIKYKVSFIPSAYYQQINENLIKLLIKVNNQTYFPEFIHHEGLFIKTKRINDIIVDILYYFLNDDEYDESES